MNQKKIAAAVTAVITYIKTQEEAAYAHSVGEIQQDGKTTARVGFNYWGLSGRQSIMNLRGMMQMKSFNKSKLR